MLGEGPTREFGYLSEPLEGPETNDADAGRRVVKRGAHRRRPARPSKVLLTLIALAAAAATVAIVMLLLRPDFAPRVDAPGSPTPASTARMTSAPPRPTGPSQAAPVPPSAEPAPVPGAVTTEAPEAPGVTTVQPAPAPSRAPTTGTNAPEATVPPPSPETRAPISVEPEPREPFPHQTPPTGGDRDRGGLLGGGGLL